MKWKPIATAPKDGTRILIFDAGYIGVAHWDKEARWGHSFEHRPGWQICGHDDAYYNYGTDTATHWMPLPKAP